MRRGRTNDDSGCDDDTARVLDAIHALMLEQSSGVVPKSLLGKGLTYLRAQWPKLIRYIENGSWPISNNPCENARRDLQGQWHRSLSVPHLAVPAPASGEDRRRLRRVASLENTGRPPLTRITTTPHAFCHLTLRGVVRGSHTATCKPHHRHQEFRSFLREIDKAVPAELDVHCIVDNYGSHKHPKVKAWLAARPRWHMHFIPTYSSWLNQVERFFALITDKAIRRGSFGSVKQLIKRIDQFVSH